MMINQLINTLLHLDTETLSRFAESLGPWFHAVLFAVVFAETGLVITPFLPGDSLLFAVGALASHPSSSLSIGLIIAYLIVAAVIGDAVNYAIGYRVGPKVFNRPNSRLLNQKHLLHAQQFYEQYGGLTIVVARFIPIVRTFAPFVAGIGKMSYTRFLIYNLAGGAAWVASFLLMGFWFGGREVVQRNFKLVIVAIVVISVVPGVFEFARARWRKSHAPTSARIEPEPETPA